MSRGKRPSQKKQARKKRARSAAGLCRDCGASAIPGKKFCQLHLEAHRDWFRVNYDPISDRRCRTCGAEGHNSTTCEWRSSRSEPAPDVAELAKLTCRCTACGTLGHNRRTCPTLTPKDGPSAPPKQRRCDHCGQLGHIRKTCPEWLRTHPNPRQKCRLCRERGHHWRLCPRRLANEPRKAELLAKGAKP